jgi:hypothetical protein
MKHLFLLLVFLVLGRAAGQTWTDAEMLERQNYGLKLGFNISSMWGGELKNPRPYFGPLAGFFWHTRETKKPWMFQTGLEGSLRGSNFANKRGDSLASTNSIYRRIGMITADVPLLINYRIGSKKENQTQVVQFGVMVSGTIRSTLYLGEDKLPAQHYLNSDSSHLYRWDNLPLKPFEVLGVVGYQNRKAYAGWQVQLLIGLNNLNKNAGTNIPLFPYAQPETITGRRISTWNLKVSALF